MRTPSGTEEIHSRVRSDLMWALLPLVGVTLSATLWGAPRVLHGALTLGLFGGLALLLLRTLPTALPKPGLGWANRVTLLRATLVLPVVAVLPFSQLLGEGGLWWVIGWSTLALSMDGVDGRVARVTRTETNYGARFDMELDAFLLLGLSTLLWSAGGVGAWVILIGALRYLFVGAGSIWPALRGDLPPSQRRKTVCVVQGVGLLLALAPVVPLRWAAGVAAVALLSLFYSFGVDVLWLLRHPRIPSRTVEF
jgi:phosphatidylglycerophosphate synthase